MLNDFALKDNYPLSLWKFSAEDLAGLIAAVKH